MPTKIIILLLLIAAGVFGWLGWSHPNLLMAEGYAILVFICATIAWTLWENLEDDHDVDVH